MTFWRLKIGLLVCVVGLLPRGAQAQFGSGGLGQSQTPTPRATQTPAQMAQDFRVLGFVVPNRHWAYRNVAVEFGDEENVSRPFFLQTRGWILPGKKNAPRSFVAWNGWVYRAKSVGQKADWRADTRALVERASRDYPQYRPIKGFSFPAGPTTWTYENDSYDDTVSLSFDALTPLKAVMLQLLGEEQLAKQAFLILKTAQKKRIPPRNTRSHNLSPDPLERFEFVEDWIWPGMNRVARAVRCGDDVTTLQTLRTLSGALDVLGKDADSQHSAPLIRSWLADWERRQSQNAAPLDRSSLAFLIWDLQNVDLRHPVNSGSTLRTLPDRYRLRSDERTQKVIALGDEAVEQLLDTFQNDHRLTRAFTTDDWNIPLYAVSVSDAALAALEGILKTSYQDVLAAVRFDVEIKKRREHPFEPVVFDEAFEAQVRAQTAASIRAGWEKLRAVPPAQRPYFVLKDDAAGAQKWLDAAHALAAPADPKFSNGDISLLRRENVPLSGEPLRALQTPSVSELLARRSNELAKKGGRKFRDSVELARILHFWDEPAGRPVVLARMRELGPVSDPYFLLKLLSIAPPEGREIYANWLHSLKRDEDNTGSADAFGPLWRNLDDPFWQQVAKDIFANPASPWNHVLSLPQPFHDLDDVFGAPLLVLPDWNTVVRRDLKDETPLGQVKWNEREIEFSIEGTPGRKHGLSPDSNLTPLQGEAPFRICDLVANALSSQLQRRSGAPPFSITAPIATRDAQIQTIITWVALQSGNSAFLKRF